MTQARGHNAQLLLDYETTFGADPAVAAALLIPFNTADLSGERNKNTAQTIRQNRNPWMPFDGNQVVSGAVTVPVDSVAFWYWLKLAFGTPTTTGTGPYAHAFKITDTQPSGVMEIGFTDISEYLKYNGVKVQSINITIGGDGELVATFNLVGAGYTAPSATPYDATPTAVDLARLHNFDAALTEGGSAFAGATNLDITVEFGLDTSQYTIGGLGKLGEIPEGIVTVSGSLTALFEDESLLTKAINSTESALVCTFTGSSSSILAINIPELQYGVKMPGVEGPQGIVQTLDFQGYYDDASEASSIVMTLTNGEAHA